MGRYIDGYNLLPDGRRIWLVQADDEAGWNWSEFLPHSRTDGPYEWGGPEWIHSAPSLKRVTEEFAEGDLVVCYQAAPSKSVVGLARIASPGYGKVRGKRVGGGSYFDLDWGCTVEPVTLAELKSDSVLANTEKARVGQGTVFRVSPDEFTRLLSMTAPVGAPVVEVERALRIVWPDSGLPTADDVELERRVRAALRKGTIPKPMGQKKPRSALRDGVVVYARDPLVKAWVLQQADGKCELCTTAAPFMNAEGEPFLETHHVRLLAKGGSDTTANAVALCPNCHRHLHHGRDAEQRVERLYMQVSRLVKE